MLSEAKELKLKQQNVVTSCEWLQQHALQVKTYYNVNGKIVDDEQLARMEWKVKRRSDGSRYMTHRPVRNRLLKERAEKLCSERQGITTDDDAASELKVGRYWTREERKRHLEVARQRKQRQLEMLRRHAAAVRDAVGEKAAIVELGHKRLEARRRGPAELLDRFVTVQEYLAHGGNNASQYKNLGILSVTTV